MVLLNDVSKMCFHFLSLPICIFITHIINEKTTEIKQLIICFEKKLTVNCEHEIYKKVKITLQVAN